MRQYRPRKQPEPTHIDIESFVPLLFRDLLRSTSMQHTSIIDEDVQSTEAGNGLFDQTVDVMFVRHISGEDERRTVHLAGDRIEPAPAAADEGKLGPFTCECEGARATDTAASASDDRNFIFQARAHDRDS